MIVHRSVICHWVMEVRAILYTSASLAIPIPQTWRQGAAFLKITQIPKLFLHM